LLKVFGFRGERNFAPDFFLVSLFCFLCFSVFPLFKDSFWGAKFFLSGILISLYFLKAKTGRLKSLEFVFLFFIFSVFFEKFEFFYFFWFFSAFAVYFVASRGNFQTEKIKKLSSFFVFLISLFSIFQFSFRIKILEAPLPHAFFGNPMYLGAFLAGLLPFPLSGFLGEKNFFHLVSFLSGTVALALTASQSAILGFLAGIFFLLLKYKKLKLLLPAVAFIACFYFLFARKSDVRFNQSIQRRLNYYRTSLKMLKENPVKGVGSGNFRGFYQIYRLKAKLKYHTSPRWAHNDFLHFLSELGIFRGGFLVFLILLPLFKRAEFEKVPIKASFFAFVVTSLFAFPFQRISTLLLFAFFYGRFFKCEPAEKAGIYGGVLKFLNFLFLVYLILFAYGQYEWRRGISFFEKTNYSASADALEKTEKVFRNFYEVKFDLARAYYRNFEYEKAVKKYQQCLQIYFDWDICYNLALAYARQADLKNADRYWFLSKWVKPEL